MKSFFGWYMQHTVSPVILLPLCMENDQNRPDMPQADTRIIQEGQATEKLFFCLPRGPRRVGEGVGTVPFFRRRTLTKYDKRGNIIS